MKALLDRRELELHRRIPRHPNRRSKACEMGFRPLCYVFADAEKYGTGASASCLGPEDGSVKTEDGTSAFVVRARAAAAGAI